MKSKWSENTADELKMVRERWATFHCSTFIETSKLNESSGSSTMINELYLINKSWTFQLYLVQASLSYFADQMWLIK